MTKSDLKTGMRVELRDGRKCIVLIGMHNHENCIVDEDGGTCLSSFRDDLTSNDYVYADIVKVYAIPCRLYNLLLPSKTGALIWERKEEPEEMTLEEVCKALGKDIKIVKG